MDPDAVVARAELARWLHRADHRGWAAQASGLRAPS